jgi:hypothetical protein
MTHTEYHQLFLDTLYFIIHEGREIQVHLDQANPAMASICTSRWMLITAWNPLPETLSLDENKRRNQALEAEMDALGLTYLPSYGRDAAHTWEEHGYGVLDITEAQAVHLMKKYGQLAIVVGEGGGRGDLLYNKDKVL